MKGCLIAKKYYVEEMIGSGSYGEVYQAMNITNGEKVAVKVEHTNCRIPYLKKEYKLYTELRGGDGFPKIWDFCFMQSYHALVMDLLGPSLGHLFCLCNSRFSIKTVLMLADQMIERLHYLHSRNFIHCDIKPDNFVIGESSNSHKLFLIDFGLAKQYRCQNSNVHIAYRETSNFVGTARFASLGAHQGWELSRRDDMESLGHMLIYFLRGSLPWQGQKASTKKQRCEKIFEIKLSIAVYVLCEGLPEEFGMYLVYCRGLQFKEEPDYKMMQCLFSELFGSRKFRNDYMYDWVSKIQERAKEQTSKHLPVVTSGENKTEDQDGKVSTA